LLLRVSLLGTAASSASVERAPDRHDGGGVLFQRIVFFGEKNLDKKFAQI